MNPTPKASLLDCRENFRDKCGNPFVVRCPSCKRENWGAAVSSGECAWCGWSECKDSDESGAPKC